MSEISDLMARDPLKLTREDRTQIIAHYRENRERYVANIQAPKAAGGKAPKQAIPAGGLNLDDLGL